jgi:hypothetical protein
MARTKQAARRGGKLPKLPSRNNYGEACARYYVFALRKCGIQVPLHLQSKCTSVQACSKVAGFSKPQDKSTWREGEPNDRLFVISANKEHVGILDKGRKFEDVDGVHDLASLPFHLDIAQVYCIKPLKTVENPELMFDWTYYVHALGLLGVEVPQSEAQSCNTLEACRKYVKIEPIPEPEEGWIQWLKKNKNRKYLAAIPEFDTVGVINGDRYVDKSKARRFAQVNNLAQAKLFSVGDVDFEIHNNEEGSESENESPAEESN